MELRLTITIDASDRLAAILDRLMPADAKERGTATTATTSAPAIETARAATPTRPASKPAPPVTVVTTPAVAATVAEAKTQAPVAADTPQPPVEEKKAETPKEEPKKVEPKKEVPTEQKVMAILDNFLKQKLGDQHESSKDAAVIKNRRDLAKAIKDIAKHLGAERPTLLTEEQLPTLMKELDRITYDTTVGFNWLPF